MQLQEGKTIQSLEMSDGMLALQSLNGDERAFEGLYKRYRPALFKFVFNMLRDYDQACDVLQHVFLQLHLYRTGKIARFLRDHVSLDAGMRRGLRSRKPKYPTAPTDRETDRRKIADTCRS